MFDDHLLGQETFVRLVLRRSPATAREIGLKWPALLRFVVLWPNSFK